MSGLRALHERLPDGYRVLFSDVGGNRERQAFVYDSSKVMVLEKVGRLSIPPADLAKIKLPGIDAPSRASIAAPTSQRSARARSPSCS